MAFGDSGNLNTSNTIPGGTGVLTRPAPKDRIKQTPPTTGLITRPAPKKRPSVLSMPEWIRPRSYSVMEGVDTMLSKTRFAAVSKFYDTKGAGFNFKPAEIPAMIQQGILAYGKPGEGGYRVPTVGVGVDALDQFLRDNYKQKPTGQFVRARTNLGVSDTFMQKAAGSKESYAAGVRYINPGAPAALLEDAPKKSVLGIDEYDYTKMAADYVKDEDTYNTLSGKIIKEINSNGGGAVLKSIQENGATEENLKALSQYMYSPRGLYGKAQLRWLDETFMGGAGAEAVADQSRAASDNDQRQYLYEERVKEQADFEKERKKDIDAANLLYFNTDPKKGMVIPQTSWLNNALAMTVSGTGGLISSEALNGVFYDDVAKGVYKNLSMSQKQAVYSGVLGALKSGQPVHPFLYARAMAFEAELGEANQLPDQVAAADKVRDQALTDYAGSPITKGIGAIPGIGPVFVGTGLLGGLTADATNETITSGPLSSTPLKDGFDLTDMGANALKSVIRSTVSMPQGIYYGVIDPTDTAKAVANDYKDRYGSLQGFKDSAYEDPLLPIMDVLSVLSFAGTGVKAAQVARISAANKAKSFATGPGPIDMGAYNAHLDDWLNTPSNLRATSDLKPPSAFADEPLTLNAREFAAKARQAAQGDERAAMELGLFLPDSGLAMNSAYIPTIMDRAASFFEPRYRIITQQEGAPERKTALDPATVTAIRQTVPESPRAARIRFSGNPLSRGTQKAFFYTQRQVAKTPGKLPQILANLPGGYNFRFTRALREGDPAVLDLHARELIYNRMFQDDFNNLELNDAEMMAVMNVASGEMYSPTNLRTIAFKRAERARAAGLNPEEDAIIGMIEEDYKLFDDPSFLREHEIAMNEMFATGTGPRSQRGTQLLAAAERMILLREKTSHLINNSWDDSRATRAMQLRYQIAMEAADLMPDNVFAELGKRVSKIIRMNSVYHLYEIQRMDVRDLPDENNVSLRDTEGADAADIEAIAKEVESSLDYLRSDLTNRTSGSVPVLTVVEEVPNLIGNRDFVIVRRVTVNGDFAPDTGIITREALLDKRELLLPKEFFLVAEKGKRKGRIQYWDNKKENSDGYTPAQERLNELVLNEMEALFPNARDFTDKVSSESLGKRETFAERKNFNSTVASGLLSFRYQEQVGAHAAAVRRRFDDDIKTLIDSQSEIIAINDFDPQQHVAVRTARVYNTRKEAEAKLLASNRPENSIETVTQPDGTKAYIVNLNYFDVTAATLKEMRLRRVLDWDTEVAKDYFDSIERLRTENPSQAIVVVPKYFAENVGKSYKRSEKLAAKIFNMSTDMFKVLTLSLNPRFVPQQIIGSAVMLMMAYPDKAPAIMSKVLEYSVRQSHGTISKFTKNESAEFLNHNTDFMVMEQYMPRDVTENVYRQDMLSTANAKMPSKVLRYGLNSGYLIAFAWERNLRVAIGRKMAMQYPGFQAFARTKTVRDYAEGKVSFDTMAPSMFTTNSPFAAAFKLLADPESPYYDPMFLREVRHGTDMVAGNYRDFTDLERTLRNALMPFYAWTRHSALFTKRMVQERPLTTNALAWIGNYGYDKTFETGGLPEWLLDSLPMPQFLENILDLNPLNDNRVSVGGIMPFGTFGQSVAAGSNFAFGKKYGTSSAVDFLNPYARTAIEQVTGTSLLTGAPVEDKGFGGMVVDGFQGFPVIGAIVNLFKNESQLNGMRGMENAEDVFVDPEDPNSKLSIPADKLSTKFETDSNAGAFNLFSPVRAYSLDPAGLDKIIRNDFKEAGLSVPSKNSPEYRGIFATINSLQRWKRKRDFIMNMYTPAHQASNPELVARAQQQLAAEFPEIPASTPANLVESVLNGYVTLPGGD